MSKSKILKPPNLKVFTQEVGIFRDEILVIVGATKIETLAYCKKHNFRKDFIGVVKSKVLWDNFGMGRFVFDKKARTLVLRLSPFEDTWDFWETLIHELNHVVYRVADLKGLKDEEESQSYLQEFLFRAIRRKLQGYQQV